METGGMKGRKEEMVREELHQVLKNNFELDAIHSEYGMTELLSQAYSKNDGIFHAPPWMKVLIREEEDPLEVSGASGSDSRLTTHDSRLTTLRRSPFGHDSPKESFRTRLNPVTGVINVIDLANVYSCSFIATDDAGRLYADGSFEVLGRIDDSDIRGCSLMVL